VGIVIAVLTVWAIAAVPKSEAEQRQEDDAQEDWCGRYRGHAEDKR
jgi:hypothetical protein